MNNLRASIFTAFCKIPVSQLLEFQRDPHKTQYITGIIWETPGFKQLLNLELTGYSADDIANVLHLLQTSWNKPEEGSPSGGHVFNLLNTFTREVLSTQGEEPVVEYKNLLRWRELSHLLGEDLLTCSYIANNDINSRHQRKFFAWRPILSTNNQQISTLLKEGLSENHFHLLGSAPHCEISWLSLMNMITNRKIQFNKFQQCGKLTPMIQFHQEKSEESLYELTKKAAYIRLYIFAKLHYNILAHSPFSYNNRFQKNPSMDPLWVQKDIHDLIISAPANYLNVHDLQKKINSIKRVFGKKILYLSQYCQPDYWLTNCLDGRNLNGNEILCGERQFLYECFKRIILGDIQFTPLQDLFYTYLVIKSKFREEMIQVNRQVGFNNFSNYQDRKDIFLQKKDVYRKYLFKMAVSSLFANQNLRSLELRIKPQDDSQAYQKVLTDVDKYNIDRTKKHLSLQDLIRKPETRNKKYFYVLHFIKDKDNRLSIINEKELINWRQCRHGDLRRKIAKQARTLVKFRDSYPSLSHLIRGIDAASSELNARPEVFAQAFRYLKFYRSGKVTKRLHGYPQENLRATFHAGEDFCDLVDGLRSIDEAVKFLNLGEGDRIGHALALGVSPDEYYASKHSTIMVPKQWHLDNICWLISRISKYNLLNHYTYAHYLEWQFQTLFHEIYDSLRKEHLTSLGNDKAILIESVSSELYYEAWKLRGDDPFKYNDKGESHMTPNLTFWEKCGINYAYPVNNSSRNLTVANLLYYHYHFNPEVKMRGNEKTEFKITKEYINLVTEVQSKFRMEFAGKHLAIETNPTSNYLIGTFRRYDKHPILSFYNLGLEQDLEKIKKCPQLIVSINTDDQGVFNTYLENEYALMAIALEKATDDQGNLRYKPAMIYDWLDRIRKMGLEMSFGKELTCQSKTIDKLFFE